MDKKLIKEALELCLTAIKAIHPYMIVDEPCVAFEAHEAAHYALDELSGKKCSDPCKCHPHDKVYYGCQCGGKA